MLNWETILFVHRKGGYMFYKIGDLFVPIIIGALTAGAVALTVSPSLAMPLAMIIGMLWGMAAQVLVLFVLMPLFGAFEVMVPSMMAGIAGGMVAGMLAVSWLTDITFLIIIGIAVGGIVYGWVCWGNRRLKGERL